VTTETLNLVELNGYLEQHVDGFKHLHRCEKFINGQSNPTYHLFATSGEYVIRMQPVGELLKSAHAVDREFRVMSALAQSDVPVPDVLHLCLDRRVIGRLFYVMRFCTGRVFWNPQLPRFDATFRTAVYREMNRVLAALHDIDVESVGLQDFGKPGNYYVRQIGRWSQQYQATQTQAISAMDQLMEWLPNNVPEDDGQISLIHGDYRIDNLMFSTTQADAIAVLDWELSTLGHPFADLAYQCMQWRLATDAVVPGLAGVGCKVSSTGSSIWRSVFSGSQPSSRVSKSEPWRAMHPVRKPWLTGSLRQCLAIWVYVSWISQLANLTIQCN